MEGEIITPPAGEPAVVPGSAEIAPSPEATPVTPATPDGQNPAPQQAAPQEDLFDLPDGRKVDAATLANEWKTNFMPDYTQKSQKLADIQKQFGGQQPNVPLTSNNPSSPQVAPAPWTDPNWVPQSYAEIIEAAAQKMQADAVAQQQQQEQYKSQVNQFVEGQLAEIRKTEPNLSEELLFQHAHKYGFGDLKQAFQNMKDFNIAVQRTAQQTAKNVANRAADPIAGRPGNQDPSTGIDYRALQQNNGMSAVEFLRKMQGK